MKNETSGSHLDEVEKTAMLEGEDGANNIQGYIANIPATDTDTEEDRYLSLGGTIHPPDTHYEKVWGLYILQTHGITEFGD